jgi:hypothetical protein
METNEILRKQLFEVIDNQINANDPPETGQTLNRLLGLGFSEFESKQLIGQCLVLEIFEAAKHGKGYNNKRYVRNLKKLPKEPFE